MDKCFFVHCSTADENLGCSSLSILNQSKEVKSVLRYCLVLFYFSFSFCVGTEVHWKQLRLVWVEKVA